MTRTIATVTEMRRYDTAAPSFQVTLDCAQSHTPAIRFDSPQWFAWLKAPENDTKTRFREVAQHLYTGEVYTAHRPVHPVRQPGDNADTRHRASLQLLTATATATAL